MCTGKAGVNIIPGRENEPFKAKGGPAFVLFLISDESVSVE